jgi:hypothetical protein
MLSGALVSLFPRRRGNRCFGLNEGIQTCRQSGRRSAPRQAYTGTLAILGQSEGLFVIKSRAAHESDYEAALRVATFLMDGAPQQATSS